MKKLMLGAALAAAALAASAAPAGAATLEGVCTLRGTAEFEQPLSPFPTEMRWRFRSNPGQSTCSGLVNGQVLLDTPTDVFVHGRGVASCGVFTMTLGANGWAAFSAVPSTATEDNVLDFRLDLVSVGFQNTLRLTGKEFGAAAGRASIVGVEDPVAELEACQAGNGSRIFGLTATVKTAGPISG